MLPHQRIRSACCLLTIIAGCMTVTFWYGSESFNVNENHQKMPQPQKDAYHEIRKKSFNLIDNYIRGREHLKDLERNNKQITHIADNQVPKPSAQNRSVDVDLFIYPRVLAIIK